MALQTLQRAGSGAWHRAVLAESRGIDEETVSLGITANAHAALPRLGLISA